MMGVLHERIDVCIIRTWSFKREVIKLQWLMEHIFSSYLGREGGAERRGDVE